MIWAHVHALMPRLKGGDPVAWEDLAALTQPYLRAAAVRLVGRGWVELSSSDVVQEAWLKARAGFDGFRGADSPANTAACLRAWLGTIVRSQVNGLLRKAAKPQLPDRARAPDAFARD